MSNEKPYIEYNGNKYEFEASFTLKRKFDKEVKEEYKNLIIKGNIDKNQLKEIDEMRKFISENPTLKPEELDIETQTKLLSLSNLIEKIDITTLYERYCYLMLNEKYDISREEFNLILEELADDYGYDFINTFVTKVCEKVFTQVGEKKEKKPLPSWMN